MHAPSEQPALSELNTQLGFCYCAMTLNCNQFSSFHNTTVATLFVHQHLLCCLIVFALVGFMEIKVLIPHCLGRFENIESRHRKSVETHWGCVLEYCLDHQGELIKDLDCWCCSSGAFPVPWPNWSWDTLRRKPVPGREGMATASWLTNIYGEPWKYLHH